ncbi:MAG: trypsin-like peptidase domain-containing protein [Okeania sp. SIO3I5]|uniref:effector-associated domain EAD1-containing protein n=1 Tax=Okeania sp. SIO3I5 TaxID=2607805 RepID=UPI0013BBDE90|nr:effector-associated domain EAD1-containing protein [Okeania sp. SIO3I5]NEQ39159.1 trypsin-like peptidase domain-containing protein [Okeania sp. SIO3I5]
MLIFSTMELPDNLKKRFYNALLDAYRSRTELKRMVDFELKENLRSIAGEGTLKEVVYELIDSFDEKGQLEKLLEGAYKDRPEHQDLKSIYQEFLLSQPDSIISLEENNKPQSIVEENSDENQNNSNLISILTNFYENLFLRLTREILLEKYPPRKDNIPTIVEFIEQLNQAKDVDEYDKTKIQQLPESITDEKNTKLSASVLKENSTNKNEEYQKPECANFKKIDNPYSRYAKGSIVEDKRMFYGRDEFIDNLISSICNSPSAKNFVIYGQKNIGKSSILYHLEQKLKPQIIPVRFSMRGMDNLSDATFLYIIIYEIFKAFHKLAEQGYPSLTVQFPDVKKMQYNPQITFEDYMYDLSKKLRKIHEYRNAKLMLLIDDFSYIYGQIQKGFISENFMQFWKALLENKNKYFGTVLVVQGYMPKFINSFPNEFSMMDPRRISYLEENYARNLIVNPILTEKGESRYQEKAVNKLIELTAGIPYYIQIFCNRLVDYMNREKIMYVTNTDIERVKEELITGHNSLESAAFDNLISAGDENTDDISKEDIEAVLRDIAKKTKQKDYCDRSSITTKTLIPVDEILKDLETREVIKNQGNSYKIKVGLFKEWLSAHLIKIDSNNSFEESIVLITSSYNKRANVIGTGFAFYREENITYLLTCAHVVEDMGGENNVLVNDFPAEIITKGDIRGFDLAVLRVAELNHIPLLKLTILSPQTEKDLNIKICGNYLYSEEKKILRETVEGIIETSQKTVVIQSTEKATVWKLQIQKGRLRGGYSGAPVVDSETSLVLGITTNMENSGERGTAISIEALRKIWPEIPLEDI